MFSMNCNATHSLVLEQCMGQLYQAVDTYMFSLNADILALNTSLQQDQLQFTTTNPLVQSVMQKIDLIGSFIRMIYRVFEKCTHRDGHYNHAYYEFVMNAQLAQVLVRVFGIGVQIPKSPNNSSVINITGLQQFDNLINQLKTKSLQCINFLLKNKDKKCMIIANENKH
jgi:hypothetical protein